MRGDPVLREKKFTEDGHCYTLRAYGGLNYIRGNSSPHFTLTGTQWRDGLDDIGGCIHEEILKHWPELSDLAAMHLSDMDGAPMHAEANGWYFLAGALGGLGEQYHGANRNRDWKTRDNPVTEEDKAQSLEIFARHCRITLDEARALAAHVLGDKLKPGFPGMRDEVAACRTRWRVACEAMRPRWAAEAAACIAKHGLVLFGDHWEPIKFEKESASGS